MIKIAIGADHRGFEQKKIIQSCINALWVDVGTYTTERVDYPVYATKVVNVMHAGQVDCGILLCGSGAGMAIAANRYEHIYAAVAWNEIIARRVKEEDKCNVLVLPSDMIADDTVCGIVDAWLSAQFKEGRYAQRIGMIDTI